MALNLGALQNIRPLPDPLVHARSLADLRAMQQEEVTRGQEQQLNALNIEGKTAANQEWAKVRSIFDKHAGDKEGAISEILQTPWRSKEITDTYQGEASRMRAEAVQNAQLKQGQSALESAPAAPIAQPMAIKNTLDASGFQPGAVGKTKGLVEAGNLQNLNDRKVLNNPDGSWSTTSSMSFSDGGPEILIPTVVDGKRLTDDQAIAHYRQTGEHLGKFDTPENADAYAQALHESQAQYSIPAIGPAGTQAVQLPVQPTKIPFGGPTVQTQTAQQLLKAKRAELQAEADIKTRQAIAEKQAAIDAAAEETQAKTVETAGGLFQWNPATKRYDIRVGGPKAKTQTLEERTAEEWINNNPGKTLNDYQNMDAARKRATSGVGATASDPKDIAQAIIDGIQPPTLTGLYRDASPVRAELARKGYDLTTATSDWTATQKNLSSMNSNQQLKLRQAIQFTNETLPQIENAYAEWKKQAGVSGFKVFNKANLATMKQLPGAPGSAATNLDALIADFTSELGTVYKGGNSSTDESLKLAAQNLSGNWNEQTFNDAIKRLNSSLKIRSNSMQQAPQGVSPTSPYGPNISQPVATHRYNPATGQIEEIK